jgi:hypothetical protein
MPDRPDSDSHDQVESPQGPLTWQPTPGYPVYGVTPGAPPPDFERPWPYHLAPAPAMPRAAAPAPPPPVQPYPVQPQWTAAPAYPVYTEPPQAAPPVVYPQQPPVLEPDYSALPSPLGPALTPEERAAQLHGPPPPTDPPR